MYSVVLFLHDLLIGKLIVTLPPLSLSFFLSLSLVSRRSSSLPLLSSHSLLLRSCYLRRFCLRSLVSFLVSLSRWPSRPSLFLQSSFITIGSASLAKCPPTIRKELRTFSFGLEAPVCRFLRLSPFFQASHSNCCERACLAQFWELHDASMDALS